LVPIDESQKMVITEADTMEILMSQIACKEPQASKRKTIARRQFLRLLAGSPLLRRLIDARKIDTSVKIFGESGAAPSSAARSAVLALTTRRRGSPSRAPPASANSR
jgi:hypothetical protein